MQECLHKLLPRIKAGDPSFSASPRITRILKALSENPDLESLSDEDFCCLWFSQSPAVVFLKSDPIISAQMENEAKRRGGNTKDNMQEALSSSDKVGYKRCNIF